MSSVAFCALQEKAHYLKLSDILVNLDASPTALAHLLPGVGNLLDHDLHKR